jgi:hypothetical protein
VVVALLVLGAIPAQAFISPYFASTILGQEFASIPSGCGSGLTHEQYGGWDLPINTSATAPDFELDLCRAALPQAGSIQVSGFFTLVSLLPAAYATIPIQGHLTFLGAKGSPDFCFMGFALDFSGDNGLLFMQTTTPDTVGQTFSPPYGALELDYNAGPGCLDLSHGSVGGQVANNIHVS